MNKENPQKSASFLTGGDLAPDRDSAKGMFARLGKLFRDADFSFANLENALSTRGELMKGKPTRHRGHPALVAGLVDAGFDAVGIANNHMLDFGVPSLEQTMMTLRRAAIPFTEREWTWERRGSLLFWNAGACASACSPIPPYCRRATLPRRRRPA